MEKKEYDFVIVGGGPAGYSAGIYAARYNLSVLVITKERGGLITQAHVVENYPGMKSLSGVDLMKYMGEHLEYYNVQVADDIVKEITRNEKFNIKTSKGEEINAKSVLLATGTKIRQLDIPGEKEFHGKGVSYCATCDGMFFRDKTVGVIGGGDSAAKEALMLSEHCRKVYIIYRRDEIRAEPIIKERISKRDNIEVITNTNITEIKGNLKVEKVQLDNTYNDSDELELDGVFIEIGHVPRSELAEALGAEITEKGEIKVDEFMRTNVSLLYAAGDVINFGFRQAIVSASQGSIAAWCAYEDLKKEK